jgi:predicted dehydrogenase
MKSKPSETTPLPAFETLAPAAGGAGALSVALAGYGRRGEELLDALACVDGVRVAAVADIWPWRRDMARDRMRALRRDIRTYETLGELLSAEGGRVDAVLVATPDWLHANHLADCLNAGKHVYCEGELADGVEKARAVVTLARGKRLMLQGGHQRRSNPRYIHAFERVCRESQALGRVTHAYAQWHRGQMPLRAVPPRFALSAESLTRHGYDGMEPFLNWEAFRRYGPGSAAARLGQKLDVMRWFWRAEPVSVSALAGHDGCGYETPDSLMALFTFRLAATGECVRGYVQVLSTSGRGSSYEQFMGENAALTIAEVVACGDSVQPEYGRIMQDDAMRAQCWNPHIRAGRILPRRAPPELEQEAARPVVDTRVSPNAPGWPLPVRLGKPAVQPHLENFAAAVRDGAALADPPEQAFANWVAVEGALRSAAARAPVDFTARDFQV